MSTARILAVDDQLYFRVFLEDLLGREGYDVDMVASGPEALARLQEGAYDLVLTDLVMPQMDGRELIRQVKELRPEQDIVAVTTVGEVKKALEAVRLGASDYLLKPIDPLALRRAVASILEVRRLRNEHGRLLAENLDYLGAFAFYERALGLFAHLSPEALADRIAEVLCLETHAHGGVVWLERPDEPERMALAGVRGLVRAEGQAEELSLRGLPSGLEALRDPAAGSFPWPAGDGQEGWTGGDSLVVPIRHGGRLRGVARLTDRIDGGAFGGAEQDAADRLGPFVGQAVENALRFRTLERRSFRDAATGAYTRAYFEDVTRNEIQKAGRFGRTFSLVRLAFDVAEPLRARLGAGPLARWIESLIRHVSRTVRATDLLAVESESELCLLLPETDAIGAAVLKRRLRGMLDRCPEVRDLDAEERPTFHAAAVAFPADGHSLEALSAALDTRAEEDRHSVLRRLSLESTPFRGLVDALLQQAHPGRPETAEQMTRLLLEEIALWTENRGLLFIAPGTGLMGALREGLESVRGASPRTEVVVLADRKRDDFLGLPVTWVSPLRAGTQAPFLIYYGEGPSYALIRDETVAEGRTAFFHTGDPVLVEQLAFQLGRDLGFPIHG